MLGALELHCTLGNAWQLSGFVDAGRVRFQQRPWSEDSNHRSLAGAGFGLKRHGADWTLESSLAWRAGGGGPATSAPQRTPSLLVKLQMYL